MNYIQETINNNLRFNIKVTFDYFQKETLNMVKRFYNSLDENSIEYKVIQYQNGNEKFFNEIFDKYKPILERVAKRKGNNDLFGELIEVLWTAVKTFKVEYGVKFNTYYWKCANNHLGILSIRKNAKKRQSDNMAISLNKSIGGDNDTDIETFIEDKSSCNEMENILFNTFLEENIFPKISESEVTTIKMLLDGFTLEEIGKSLGGLTASGIHVKLRRLAKKPVIGKQLKELYNI